MDDSGLVLKATTKEMPRQAGVLLMGTAGKLQPKSEEHMETACMIEDNVIMHPFAFRTHTHSHGTYFVVVYYVWYLFCSYVLCMLY